MAEIALQQLTKRFPNGVTALSDVSVTIADGECVVLLGPSGCGKTTLLRLLAGLETPTSGSISIAGCTVTDTRPASRNLAFVFQRPALYPHLSVERNLLFSSNLQQSHLLRWLGFLLARNRNPRPDLKARLDQTVKLLELEDLLARWPRQLSGGQQQRVALGRTILRDPKAFLLDEPLSGLDLPQRVELRRQLHLLQRHLHATILYVTHDQTEAMALADRVVVLNQGVVQQAGPPAEVFEQPANRFVAGFVGSPAMSFLTGQLRGKCTTLRLVANGAQISLPESIGNEMRACSLNRITLGIRPENVRLGGLAENEASASERLKLAMKVASVEYLGNGCLVRLRCSGWDLTSQQPDPVPWTPGSEVVVVLDRNHLHWFDAESGNRLNLASVS